VRTDSSGRAFNNQLLTSVSGDVSKIRFLNLTVADSAGHVIGLSNAPRAGMPLTVADRKYYRDAVASRGIGIGRPPMTEGTWTTLFEDLLRGPAGAAVAAGASAA
jgi:hypothetical protein